MIFPEILDIKAAYNETQTDDDLIKLLAEETKPNTTNAPQGPAPNPNDFEAMEPEPEPELEPEPIQKPAVEIIKTPPNYYDEAKLLIGFVDAMQVLILPIAYQNTIFSPQEREKIRQWKKTGQPAPENRTEKEKELIARIADYKELVQDIDFSEDEIKALHDPLTRVMQKYNWRMNAEMALMGAVLAIMGPRLMPLTNRFEKLL